jgi:hypothetical protein
MNMNKQQIIEYNNTKINYFNLLVKNNKIPIDCDIVVDKINPLFSKKASTLQYINNIVCREYIDNLLYNFRYKTKNYLENKSIRNFEDLLNTNREKINKKLIKQLTDTLNLSKTKIPTSKTLDFYYNLFTTFNGDSFIALLLYKFLVNDDDSDAFICHYDYSLTLKILKNRIIKDFTDKLTNISKERLLHYYKEYLYMYNIINIKHTLNIEINIDIKHYTNIEIENQLEKLF